MIEECPDGGPASACAECVAQRSSAAANRPGFGRLIRDVVAAQSRRACRWRSRLRCAAADAAEYFDAYALASLAAMCLPGVAVYWKEHDDLTFEEHANDALFVASRIFDKAREKVRG